MIVDVTSKNNQEDGMYLTGTGITVNNANIKNNGFDGLVIGSNAGNNDITLAGDITSTNNYYGFATTSSAQGTVRVTGNLISNHNVNGVDTSTSNLLTIELGGSNSESLVRADLDLLRLVAMVNTISTTLMGLLLSEVILHVIQLMGFLSLIARLVIQVVMSPQRRPPRPLPKRL